jgi:hypothetical protein
MLRAVVLGGVGGLELTAIRADARLCLVFAALAWAFQHTHAFFGLTQRLSGDSHARERKVARVRVVITKSKRGAWLGGKAHVLVVG